MERPTGQTKFAGGDQRYLREEQYRDASRLEVRAALHRRFSVASVPWYDWVGERIALPLGGSVLDVGCGAGWLWAETAAAVPDRVTLMLTDLSAGMVEEAVTRVEATGRFASVKGRTADLMALPFEVGSFDRVVANHMLYHLPSPAAGVAQLARVVRAGGTVVAATNGEHHMRELHEVTAEVFGGSPVRDTVQAFGAQSGFAILREHFDEVTWHGHPDGLRCTDPAAVVAYICSTPPGEDATDAERAAIAAAVHARFDAGDGVMRITKDVGAFVCRSPR